MSNLINETRENFVPEMVKDLVKNYLTAPNANVKDNYRTRVEAIREYCEAAIAKGEQKSWVNQQLKKNR
jgi:hypothetical protein